jgi:hypothetical protein
MAYRRVSFVTVVPEISVTLSFGSFAVAKAVFTTLPASISLSDGVRSALIVLLQSAYCNEALVVSGDQSSDPLRLHS